MAGLDLQAFQSLVQPGGTRKRLTYAVRKQGGGYQAFVKIDRAGEQPLRPGRLAWAALKDLGLNFFSASLNNSCYLALIGPVQHFAVADGSTSGSLHLPGWSDVPNRGGLRTEYAAAIKPWAEALANTINGTNDGANARFFDLLPFSYLALFFTHNGARLQAVFLNARQRVLVGPDQDAPTPFEQRLDLSKDVKAAYAEPLFKPIVKFLEMPLDDGRSPAWSPQASFYWDATGGGTDFQSVRIWSGLELDQKIKDGLGATWKNKTLAQVIAGLEASKPPASTRKDVTDRLGDLNRAHVALAIDNPTQSARVGSPLHALAGLESTIASASVLRDQVSLYPFLHALPANAIGLGFARRVSAKVDGKARNLDLLQWFVAGALERAGDEDQPADALVQGVSIENLPASLGVEPWAEATKLYLDGLAQASQAESFMPQLAAAVGSRDATPWAQRWRIVEKLPADSDSFGRHPALPPRLEREAVRARIGIVNGMGDDLVSGKVTVEGLAVGFPGLHAAPGTRPGLLPVTLREIEITAGAAKIQAAKLTAPTVKRSLRVKFDFDGGEEHAFGLGALDLKLVPQKAGSKGEVATGGAGWDLDIDYPGSSVRVAKAEAAFDRLPVAAAPGGQDPADDNRQAWPAAGTTALEARFSRQAPLLLADKTSDLRLKATEVGSRASVGGPGRTLEVRLTSPGEAGGRISRVVVIDTAPLSLFGADASALDARTRPSGDEIATRISTPTLPGRWRLHQQTDTAKLWLPPQAVGEAMEKSKTLKGDVADGSKGGLVDYRFTPGAELTIRIEERDRTPQPPWNIRALLGDPSPDLPGVKLNEAIFHLAYGMRTQLAGDNLRLVEQAGWRGELPRPSYARIDEIQTFKVGPLQKEIVRKYDAWADAYAAWTSRLGLYEVRDERRLDGALDRNADVQFELLPGYTRNPLAGGDAALRPHSRRFVREDDGLAGGVLWGFESAILLESTLRDPASVGGGIRRLAFSALGGTGDQEALFDETRQKISTSTDISRQHGYSLVRTGRIGVLWNRAIHVRRFERVPLLSPQYAEVGGLSSPSDQDPQQGRMIIRLVEEYVEILEPERATGAQPLTGSEFVSRRMRVDSAWGRDITLRIGGKDEDYGWEVPLWNREASDVKPSVYPFPEIWLKTATGGDAQRPEERHRLLDPQKLYFYADARQGTGGNSDTWEPIYGVDYIDAPHDAPDPNKVRLDDLRGSDDRTLLPSPAPVPPGLERFTWAIAPGERTNLTAGRAAESITAHLETLTAMRAAPAAGGSANNETRTAANSLAPAAKAMLDSAETLLRNAGIGDYRTAQERSSKAAKVADGAINTALAVLGALSARLAPSAFPGLPAELEPARAAAAAAVATLLTAARKATTDLTPAISLIEGNQLAAADLPLLGETPPGKLQDSVTALAALQARVAEALDHVSKLRQALALARLTTFEAEVATISTELGALGLKVTGPIDAFRTELSAARLKADHLIAQATGAYDQVTAVKDQIQKALKTGEQIRDAIGGASDLCKLAENEINAEFDKASEAVRSGAGKLKDALVEEREAAKALIQTIEVEKLKPAARAALDGAEAVLEAGLSIPGFAVQSATQRLDALVKALKQRSEAIGEEATILAADLTAQIPSFDTQLIDAEAKARGLIDALKSGIAKDIDAAARTAIDAAVTIDRGAADLAAIQARLRQLATVDANRLRSLIEQAAQKTPASWRAFVQAARERAVGALDAITAAAGPMDRALTDLGAELTTLSLALRIGARGVQADLAPEAMRTLDAVKASFPDARDRLAALGTSLKTEFRTAIKTQVDALDLLTTSMTARVADLNTGVVDKLKGWTAPIDKLRADIRKKFTAARAEIDNAWPDGAPPPNAPAVMIQVLDNATASLANEADDAVKELLDAVKARKDILTKAVCAAFKDAGTYLEDVIAAVDDLKVGKRLEALVRDLKLDGKDLSEVLGALEKGVAEALRGLNTQVDVVSGWASELMRQVPTDFHFRLPSPDFALLRAFGRPPELPDLGFNRDALAYFFDFADRVRITPSFALLDRWGEHMRGLSVSLPTVDLGWRLEPPKLGEFPNLDIGRIDLGQILPDMGWLKLDALFKGKPIGLGGGKGVTVTHGVDKKAMIAWAKADIDLDLGDADLLPPQIMRLNIQRARLTGLLRLQTNARGQTERQVQALLKGDWALGVAGVDLATLREARFEYDQSAGPRLIIDPSKVDYSAGLAFISALAKQFAPSGDFSDMERMLENGLPKAFSSKIDIPIPDVAAGAFALSNLQFSAGVSGEILPEFRISAWASLGGPTKPFALTVSFLGGGGYFTARTSYAPISHKRSTEVVIAVGVCAGAAFSLGPIGGGVLFWFGIQAKFIDNGGGGGGFSAAAIMVITGSVTVWGFATVGIGVVLSIEYSNGGAVGYGSVSVSIRISRFYKKSFSRSFQKALAGQGGGGGRAQLAAAIAPPPPNPNAPRPVEKAYGGPLFDQPASANQAAAAAVKQAAAAFALIEV